MDSCVRLIVYNGRAIFDSVIVTSTAVIKREQDIEERGVKWKKDDNSDNISEDKKLGLVCLNKKGVNAYAVSEYIVTLIRSDAYRKAALEMLLHLLSCKFTDRPHIPIVFIKLRTPTKHFLDYKWNERMTQMALERRELDYAMSWLSTLGGAFSALGDEFHYCAEMAGKISVKQFQLALRLGDPLLVARCKLYASLSFIQQGEFKIPKRIVQSVYKFAKAQKDIKLQNMCHGIWAKLAYCYKMHKKRRSNS